MCQAVREYDMVGTSILGLEKGERRGRMGGEEKETRRRWIYSNGAWVEGRREGGRRCDTVLVEEGREGWREGEGERERNPLHFLQL